MTVAHPDPAFPALHGRPTRGWVNDPIAGRLAPANIWECPNLVPLGDRWVLIVSLWTRHGDATRLAAVRYLVGDLGVGPHGPRFTPAARRLKLALVDVGGVERIVVERAPPADPRTAPRLLVDGSMIELFDGGPTAYTTRAYPTTASRWVLHLDSPVPIRAWRLGLD